MTNLNGNRLNMKKANRNRIYQLVYHYGEISKPEIAQKLGISLPTAIQNVKLLQEEGLLQEGDMLESTGGRKAVAVICNANARYSVGIDITRNHIRVVIINLKAEVLLTKRISRRFENTPEFFSDIGQLVASALENQKIDPQAVLGVGFSVPGVMSVDRKLLVYSHALNVSGLQCSQFTRDIPFPGVLCNDANAAGYAEMWSDHMGQNAVYFSLSNTVGGAVILGEELFYGENQRAGEFGHMTLVRDGLPCYCGRNGCVDSYCSAQTLSRHTGGDLHSFFERLKSGEKDLQDVWRQYLGWLATAINNLTIALDARVILGGYLGEYLEEYLDDLRVLVANVTTFSGNENYISVCKYKHDAAAVGAALLFVRPFIEQV